MSIYVDDSLLACPDAAVGLREMNKICKYEGNAGGRFEGTVLEPQKATGYEIDADIPFANVERYDVLGADLLYSAENKWCRWSMTS